MRVMTWNLWWRFGPWEARQPAISRTLADANADIILLQEVFVDPNGENQAERLANELGYHFTYGNAVAHDGIALGNAILSRWPLIDPGITFLPETPGSPEPRCAVHAHVDSPDGPVPVISTHLCSERNQSSGRWGQTYALMHLADEMATDYWPPILGGDFNADPISDEIRLLTGRAGKEVSPIVFQDVWEQAGDGSAGYTWTSDNKHFPATRLRPVVAMPWTKRRMDYLFVGLPDGRSEPFAAVQAEKTWIVGRGYDETSEGSDHYGLLTILSDHSLMDPDS